MDVITVKTPRGVMRINPKEFFPATKVQLMKLIRIINYPFTGEGPEKILELQSFLTEYIQEMEKAHKRYLTAYVKEDTPGDEFDQYYYAKHNQLLDTVLKRIEDKKKRCEGNLEYLREP